MMTDNQIRNLQKANAEMRAVLECWLNEDDHTGIYPAARHALSTNCGKDYVPKSQLEAAQQRIKGLDCSVPNQVAYRLGKLASEVGTLGPDKAGDEIDRGLILIRRLKESGYAILATEALENEKQQQ